jgi:hypothetical protein
MSRLILFVALSSSWLCSFGFSNAAIVYDAPLQPFAGGGWGFWTIPEIGQAISLAGTARNVTQFEIGVGASETTEYRVRFYELDGRGGGPGTLIWESSPQIFQFFPPAQNRRVEVVDIPNVAVPDSFAWTIAPTIPSGLFHLRTVNPPATVGTALSIWARVGSPFPDYDWSEQQFDLSARITAVPEPATWNGCAYFALAIAMSSRPRRAT